VAKDLNYLGRQMRKYAEAAGKDTTAFQTEVALSVVASVSMATPVDVGTARSNWKVSLGSQWIGVRRAFSPFASRHRKPYGAGGTQGETRNQAGVVWSAAATVKGVKEGQAIYINNNLPYIGPLNRGHSPQAGAGFIKRAITKGQQRAIASFQFPNIKKV
jgi:hypothetical protein